MGNDSIGTVGDRGTPDGTVGVRADITSVAGNDVLRDGTYLLSGEKLVCVAGAGLHCFGEGTRGETGRPVATDTLLEYPGLASADTVSFGAFHGCTIEDDEVRCWGRNDRAQLGRSLLRGQTASNDIAPISTEFDTAPDFVVAAYLNSFAGSRGASSVFAWGARVRGSLGDGAERGADTAVPIEVPLSGPIRALRVGEAQACAILEDGRFECWGDNRYLQFSRTSSPRYLGPTLIELPPGVTPAMVQDVALTDRNIFLLVMDGRIFASGSSYRGDGLSPASTALWSETVRPDDMTASVIASGYRHSCAVFGPMEIVACWGSNEFRNIAGGTPLRVGELTGVRALAAGRYSSCALTDGGDVYCWGRGTHGACGSFEDSGEPTLVATGAQEILGNPMSDHYGIVQVVDGRRVVSVLGDGRFGFMDSDAYSSVPNRIEMP